MFDNLIGKVVTLKDGVRGRCIAQLESGEYLLQYEKGGRIIGFYKKDIVA